MPLETAVRKLTGVQADILGFEDRGYLRPGDWADVVVFDPETVAPGPTRRVRDFPAGAERLTADAPVGICHVLVNGVAVQEDGTRVNWAARPEHVLRNGVARR
jgi:N-acyl-D-aspartate/D-glutamate deacylase